jgi:hypothetical protein
LACLLKPLIEPASRKRNRGRPPPHFACSRGWALPKGTQGLLSNLRQCLCGPWPETAGKR